MPSSLTSMRPGPGSAVNPYGETCFGAVRACVSNSRTALPSKTSAALDFIVLILLIGICLHEASALQLKISFVLCSCFIVLSDRQGRRVQSRPRSAAWRSKRQRRALTGPSGPAKRMPEAGAQTNEEMWAIILTQQWINGVMAASFSDQAPPSLCWLVEV